MDGMRRITEFKGYKSVVGYDSETGQFVTVPLPQGGIDEDIELHVADIVPFAKSQPIRIQSRNAG
mgnify:CR=1 FL=1